MVEERIREYLSMINQRSELVDKLRSDDSLIERGVLDSLGLLQLAGFLETEFGLPIDETELIADNFETIAAVVRYVRSKTSAPTQS